MIVAGFGFRQTATEDSLLDALRRAQGSRSPALLATAADKAEAPAFRAFSARLDLPVRAVPQDALAQAETPTRSTAVHARRGTGSVAEAAALVAAGPGASLLGPRVVSADRMATCALAKGPVP
jgi:cobalt-precorrin 5A hydrolase